MDPYEILGLDRRGGRALKAEEVKRAFRERSRQVHPDRQGGSSPQSEEDFKQLSAAYEVVMRDLSEPEPSTGEAKSTPTGGLDRVMSGLGRAVRGAVKAVKGQRGRDLSVAIDVPFLEAAMGSTRRIAASGLASSSDPVTFRLPAGVKDGARLLVAGRGAPSEAPDGPAGDLYVIVHVIPHPLLVREGSDLHCTIPITMFEAALGANVPVPTLRGIRRVRIPRGTHHGEEIRLGGAGIRIDGEPPGDLVVTVRVEVPRNLTDDQAAGLSRLETAVPDSSFPERCDYLAALKSCGGQ